MGDKGGAPGKQALLSLLAITMTGAMAGTMINAPLPDIQAEFRVTDAEIILPVAMFTIMMVICSPMAGWLCDWAGSVRMLLLSVSIMSITHLIVAASTSLEMLIIVRAFSGAACSTFPPGVQRSLVSLWPGKAQSSLTAWASSIGLGMAVGPAAGGLIAEFMGWRWIFIFHGAVCALLAIVVVLVIPKTKGSKEQLHWFGMTVLTTVMGGMIIGVTLVGQRVNSAAAVAAGLVAGLGIALLLRTASRDSGRLFEPRSLLEKRYLRGTLVAAVAMFILGVYLVCLPLYLGELGLTSGIIGLLLFVLAFSMTLSGGANSWLASHTSPRLTMQVGLALLILAPLLLTAWVTVEAGTSPRSLLVLGSLLVLSGTGINAAQSISAFAISRSVAAKNSVVFGIHNTVRFLGMGSGYSWAALTFSLGEPLVVFGGAAAMAALALFFVVIGGPPAPLNPDAPK